MSGHEHNGSMDQQSVRRVADLTAASSPLVTAHAVNTTPGSSFGAVGSLAAKASPAHLLFNFGDFDLKHLDHAFVIERMPAGLGLIEIAKFLNVSSDLPRH